jgi:phytoene dehydrogenase-like protein
MLDAIIVGAGPNGLVAAITLAQAGLAVRLVEARPTVGGGARTAELTLPGFLHDVCSAVHPLGRLSPALRALPLEGRGLHWIDPPLALAHPLDDGSAAVLARSIDETTDSFQDEEDAAAYRATWAPLVRDAAPLYSEILGPLRPPRHPIVMARFGVRAMRSARGLVRMFRTERARALIAGCAAHSFLTLEDPFSAAFGLVLGVAAHVVGWPIPRGGSQAISDALAAHLVSLGGAIETGHVVRSLEDLPPARAYLFDVAPRSLARIAGDALPAGYRRRLERFRHGPGVFKLDLALDGPIPWRAPECALAATVHVGGTFDEISESERAMARGEHAKRPYVLVAQQSLFDPTRAPAGRHTAWAYCHVPSGSSLDRTEAILAQIERFAPGFRDRIQARHAMGTAAFETYDANYVGGDINGGAVDGLQLFARPVLRAVPCATPNPALYLCSASTPPGGGVHGMCGWFAARTALQRVFGYALPDPHD